MPHHQRSKVLPRKIVPILKQHGAVKAGLFGSLVTGHLRQDSDIDILVELPPELSLLDLVSLKLDLQEALDREVDLVEYPLIHPYLKDKVLQQEVYEIKGGICSFGQTGV